MNFNYAALLYLINSLSDKYDIIDQQEKQIKKLKAKIKKQKIIIKKLRGVKND